MERLFVGVGCEGLPDAADVLTESSYSAPAQTFAEGALSPDGEAMIERASDHIGGVYTSAAGP